MGKLENFTHHQQHDEAAVDVDSDVALLLPCHLRHEIALARLLLSYEFHKIAPAGILIADGLTSQLQINVTF